MLLPATNTQPHTTQAPIHQHTTNTLHCSVYTRIHHICIPKLHTCIYSLGTYTSVAPERSERMCKYDLHMGPTI